MKRLWKKACTLPSIACALALCLLLSGLVLVATASPGDLAVLLGSLGALGFALTPTTGPVYDLQQRRKANAREVSGPLEVAKFTYTATAAGQGVAQMGSLPPGKVRVFPDHSRLIAPDGANAASTVDVGYAAYVDSAGATQAASGAAFGAAVAYGAGAIDAAFTLPAAPADYDAVFGLAITIEIKTADIAIGETITVYVAYAPLN